MSDDIKKINLGRWRLGFKAGVPLSKSFLSRLTCGCWRLWVGQIFIGRKCFKSQAHRFPQERA
jgi:hypothetical protein